MEEVKESLDMATWSVSALRRDWRRWEARRMTARLKRAGVSREQQGNSTWFTRSSLSVSRRNAECVETGTKWQSNCWASYGSLPRVERT